MASKDRYERNINCPKCNGNGILHISENDYPFMKKLGRNVDSVEGEFDAKMHGEFDIKIICKNCGEEFIE